MRILRAWHGFTSSGSPIIDVKDVPLDWSGLATLSGPSGSGKTTLFRLLSGWYDDDRTVCEFDPPLDRFRQIRFIGAQDSLLPWRSVEGNLRFHGFPPAVIDSVLTGVGLNPEIRSRPVYEMSYGMYKRIELLIAIAEKPELLLLDEFFSSIDDIAKTVIRDYVLSARPQYPTWIIAHEENLRRWLSPVSYSLVVNQERRCVVGIKRL
ncbi:MAG: ATP-binding cassette domain-containing protein [Acidobacteriota bacterium]